MEIINFNSTDDIELNGILYNQTCSNIQDRKIILSVHGISSNCFKKRDNVISKYANANGMDYFCFNNRGSELARYLTKKKQIPDSKKILGGSTFEDVLDGYYDICGAILKLVELGYTKIYLQGHSLGCTKIVYTYHRLQQENSQILKYIKGIILLSLVDITSTLKFFLQDKYQNYINMAELKESEGKIYELMPRDSFLQPVSVKTFLRYARDNEEIDFVSIEKDSKLSVLNAIDVPIFMRWGNINELILEDAKIYSEKMNNIIENRNKDINYIPGANHSYNGKEAELSKQIIEFINKL